TSYKHHSDLAQRTLRLVWRAQRPACHPATTPAVQSRTRQNYHRLVAIDHLAERHHRHLGKACHALFPLASRRACAYCRLCVLHTHTFRSPGTVLRLTHISPRGSHPGAILFSKIKKLLCVHFLTTTGYVECGEAFQIRSDHLAYR